MHNSYVDIDGGGYWNLKLIRVVILCRFLTLARREFQLLIMILVHHSSFWSISARKNMVA